MLRSIVAAAWLAAFLCGCTAINTLELQNAETLGAGKTAGGYGVGFGPDVPNLYRDSSWTMANALSIPYLIGRADVAVTNTTDASVSAWTVATPYLLFGLAAGYFETVDVGAAVGIKQMLFGREGNHKMAVQIGGIGYGARWVFNEHFFFDSTSIAGIYGSYGLGGGIGYTWAFDSSSFYCGVKSTWLYSDETFVTARDYETVVKQVYDDRVFWTPYIGWTLDRNHRRIALELSGVIGGNPSTNQIEGMVFAGVGVRFVE
ncbi:MAG: hypothetical protein DYG96_12045 [Chlorobi bacterium CHB2]|nr:hypothetical protein [Chlorobi bacterium CHB2]